MRKVRRLRPRVYMMALFILAGVCLLSTDFGTRVIGAWTGLTGLCLLGCVIHDYRKEAR